MTFDISVENLTMAYRKGKKEFVAIESISFQANQGEFITILGPSGCGKSTLLRVLAGLESPSAGFVEFNPERIRRGDIGYVPQSADLLPWRTLLQNAFIGSEMGHEKYTRASLERVRDMIDTFRLAGFEDSYPNELSGGMKQRVSLIRALQLSPSILFCDEPFSAVDFVSRFEFNTIFREQCCAIGTTCIMVTHNIEEAIYLSDRILLMGGSPGRLVKEYPYRYLPNRHDAVLCRQSSEFNVLFDEIWSDLKSSYRRRL